MKHNIKLVTDPNKKVQTKVQQEGRKLIQCHNVAVKPGFVVGEEFLELPLFDPREVFIASWSRDRRLLKNILVD